ncbi:unnamed protein product, partial [Rotaria magnacalcarata]
MSFWHRRSLFTSTSTPETTTENALKPEK